MSDILGVLINESISIGESRIISFDERKKLRKYRNKIIANKFKYKAAKSKLDAMKKLEREKSRVRAFSLGRLKPNYSEKITKQEQKVEKYKHAHRDAIEDYNNLRKLLNRKNTEETISKSYSKS
jgi:hypothetical protein